MRKSIKARTRLLMAIAAAALIGCQYRDIGPSLVERQHAEALIDKGTALLRIGNVDAAEAAFRVSQQLSPSAAALDGLGCVAYRRMDYQRAEDCFRNALVFDPDYKNAISNLASLYDIRGRKNEAKGLFEYAIAHEPENIRARNNFSVLLAEDNQRERAREEFLMGQALAPAKVIVENLKRLKGTSRGNNAAPGGSQRPSEKPTIRKFVRIAGLPRAETHVVGTGVD